MKYPKKIMKKSELVKLGFPERLLDRAYRARNQHFANKMNPYAPNSTILYDTDGFERWLKTQKRLEV